MNARRKGPSEAISDTAHQNLQINNKMIKHKVSHQHKINEKSNSRQETENVNRLRV